jgi:DNA-binding IclR family transcriptional regulator
MTSSKLMAEVLRKLPDEPAPIEAICQVLERPDGNVRRILADMERLGLVEKVEISIPDRKVRCGWKKTVRT